MDSATVSQLGTSVDTESEERLPEIFRSIGLWHPCPPTERIWDSFESCRGLGRDPGVVGLFLESSLDHRWPDLVEPGFEATLPGGGESRARELLRVESQRWLLRRVLVFGECSC